MSLDTTVKLSISALLQGNLDFVSPVVNLVKTWELGLASGTGASQNDKLWYDQRTLTASSTEDLDLNGSALQDALGQNLAFLKVKGLIVIAAAANVNNVHVGGAAANGFVSWVGDPTDKVVVPPSGHFYLAAPVSGFAVTAGTADLLRIGNSAGGSSVVYDIVIFGTSA